MVNTLDLYQTQTPVVCQFTTLVHRDSLGIYAKVKVKEPVEDSLWISFSWDLSGNHFEDSTMLSSDHGNQCVLKWGFGGPVPPVITVRVNWKASSWIFQEHFPMNAYHISGGLSLWKSGNPVFDTWLQAGDSIRIISESSSKVFAYYYSHSFDPARPPMTLRAGKNDEPLSIDSIMVLPSGQYYAPSNPGLYFFQSDSSTTLGSSLVVTDEYFPKPQDITDLTEPLVYITTKSEYRQLRNDLSNKQALDKFWLSTLGSPEQARKAIKSYYQNVEEANLLFTSYKEGWKTDRGMIYTVLGTPLTVTKTLDTERWSYKDRAGNDLVFVFKKISNIFSNNHYELLRDTAYDRQWFQAIDRWRKGPIN